MSEPTTHLYEVTGRYYYDVKGPAVPGHLVVITPILARAVDEEEAKQRARTLIFIRHLNATDIELSARIVPDDTPMQLPPPMPREPRRRKRRGDY